MGFLEGDRGRVTGAVPSPGSDKEAILELITSRSNRQRQEICQSYKSLYGKVTGTEGRGVGWGTTSFSWVFLRGLSEPLAPGQPLLVLLASFSSVRDRWAHSA